MAGEERWKKAIGASLIFHAVVLMAAGWMAAQIFISAEVPERYVELELISGDYGAYEPAGSDLAVDMSQAASAAKAETAVRETAAMPTVQVSPDNMALIATEPGPSASGTPGEGKEVRSGGTGTGNITGGTGGGSGNSGGGTGKTKGGGGVISPGILAKVEPVYPEEARRSGQEGTVVVKIQILENGRAGHVQVYRSSGYGTLDEAAVTAVRQWRFVPAKERDSGQAIVCYTTMPVVFRLKS